MKASSHSIEKLKILKGKHLKFCVHILKTYQTVGVAMYGMKVMVLLHLICGNSYFGTALLQECPEHFEVQVPLIVA